MIKEIRKTTVLVVDDHPAIRSTMMDILREEGFSADQAINGAEALAKCQANEFDFVLLDVQMPELNGVEALSEMKKQANEVQVQFFSAYSAPELEEQALASSYVFQKTDQSRKDSKLDTRQERHPRTRIPGGRSYENLPWEPSQESGIPSNRNQRPGQRLDSTQANRLCFPDL